MQCGFGYGLGVGCVSAMWVRIWAGIRVCECNVGSDMGV